MHSNSLATDFGIHVNARFPERKISKCRLPTTKSNSFGNLFILEHFETTPRLYLCHSDNFVVCSKSVCMLIHECRDISASGWLNHSKSFMSSCTIHTINIERHQNFHPWILVLSMQFTLHT